MAKSTLKLMAKNAKNRLRFGYEKEAPVIVDSIPSVEKEKKRIYEKVIEIVNSEEPITNPIGLLIDEVVYAKLSPSERERYVLELSRIYIELTEKLLRFKE